MSDIWFERTLRQCVETELTEAKARIAELEAALRVKQLQVNDAVGCIAELEAAIDKLAQCKGRFHTEANFKALIEVREKNLHK